MEILDEMLLAIRVQFIKTNSGQKVFLNFRIIKNYVYLSITEAEGGGDGYQITYCSTLLETKNIFRSL